MKQRTRQTDRELLAELQAISINELIAESDQAVADIATAVNTAREAVNSFDRYIKGDTNGNL